MDNMYKVIEIKNQNELLRVYEDDLKHASSEQEKNKLNSCISEVKTMLSKLEG